MATEEFIIGEKVGVPTLGRLSSTEPVAVSEDIARPDGTSLEKNIINLLCSVASQETSISDAATKLSDLISRQVTDVKVNSNSVVSNNVANIQLKSINGESIVGEGNIELSPELLSADFDNKFDIDMKKVKLTDVHGVQLLPATSADIVFAFPGIPISKILKGIYRLLSLSISGLNVILGDEEPSVCAIGTNEQDLRVSLNGNEYQYMNGYLKNLPVTSTVLAAKLTDQSFASESSPFSNKNFVSLDLDNVNTEGLTTFLNCFRDCRVLQTIFIRNANMSAITILTGMLENCEELTNIELGASTCSVLTSIAKVAYKCGKLVSLDLSKFDMSHVTNTLYAFYKCTALENLKIGNGLAVSIDLGYCPLSASSISLIFAGLADLTGKQTENIIISSTTDAILTDAIRTVATGKNWNICTGKLSVDPDE